MINHLRLEDPPGVKEYTLCALCFIMNFVTQTKKKKKVLKWILNLHLIE